MGDPVASAQEGRHLGQELGRASLGVPGFSQEIGDVAELLRFCRDSLCGSCRGLRAMPTPTRQNCLVIGEWSQPRESKPRRMVNERYVAGLPEAPNLA